MTFTQACYKMAKLLVQESDYFDKHQQDGAPGIECPDSPELLELRYETKKFGFECAADPELQGLLIPWMIDIHGSGACDVTENSLELLHNNPQLFTTTTGGGIAAAVETIAKQHGFTASDRGAGSCSWHLGFACDDAEAQRLCAILHSHFAKAITTGLISVQKKFWGWRLKGLYTWTDAKRYLNDLE